MRAAVRRNLGIVALAMLTLLAGMLAWQALPIGELLRAARSTMLSWGWLGQLLFVLSYAAAVVVFAPATPLTVAAGAVYGYWGAALALAGALGGAVIAFLIARRSLRGPCRFLCSQRRYALALDRAIGALGWRGVLLVRLSPVLPFTLQNYLFGMTAVSLRDYWIASLIGMLPATLVKVWLGIAGAHLGSTLPSIELAQQEVGVALSWPALGLLAVGVLATVALIAIVVRRARIERDRLRDEPDPLPLPAT